MARPKERATRHRILRYWATNGMMSNARTAIALGCSERQVSRIRRVAEKLSFLDFCLPPEA